MIKNKVYNNLTEVQRAILAEVIEGKNLEDKAQLSEAIGEIFLKYGEEDFLEPNGISDEYAEDLNEVERYLKSLGDKTIRTKNLLEDAVKQNEIYKPIDDDFDFYKVIHGLGQSYGFTDEDVEEMVKVVGFKN